MLCGTLPLLFCMNVQNAWFLGGTDWTKERSCLTDMGLCAERARAAHTLRDYVYGVTLLIDWP
jgi:hypothetical protein